MGFVTLETGARVHYVEHGTGPVLVQIHGTGLAHRNFEKVTPFLGDAFRCIDIDMPGYGESDPATRGLGVVELADEVADFLRSFGETPVHVHGSSFGGVVALALAGRHPDLIDRLVASVCLPRNDKAARYRRRMWLQIAEFRDPYLYTNVTMESGFSRAFYERPDAEKIMDSVREAMAKASPDLSAYIVGTQSMMDTDIVPFIEAIRAETLLIGADEDVMTPHKVAASGYGLVDVATAVPGARLEVVEGSGHYVLLEQPEEVARLIKDFVL